MIRFLLGVLVGGVATASYLTRHAGYTPRAPLSGRVDELSTAANNIVADPSVNAGDGTPGPTSRATAIA
jgi:hypothetical protein